MKPIKRPAVVKSILVVDDDPDILEMVVQVLQTEGYEVVAARNPEEFQTAFDTSPLPHLVLLDIRMPSRDGFGLASDVRSKFNIPIIFMTAHDCAKYRLYAPIAGASDYIQKPFDPDVLLAAVAKALGAEPQHPTNDWLLGTQSQTV